MEEGDLTQHPLSGLADSWAQSWETLLQWFVDNTGTTLNSEVLVTSDGVHEDLVELANSTIFSGHDLAYSLHLLLNRHQIEGRWGKVYLEFQYEWVIPAQESGVKELFPYLQNKLERLKNF